MTLARSGHSRRRVRLRSWRVRVHCDAGPTWNLDSGSIGKGLCGVPSQVARWTHRRALRPTHVRCINARSRRCDSRCCLRRCGQRWSRKPPSISDRTSSGDTCSTTTSRLHVFIERRCLTCKGCNGATSCCNSRTGMPWTHRAWRSKPVLGWPEVDLSCKFDPPRDEAENGPKNAPPHRPEVLCESLQLVAQHF